MMRQLTASLVFAAALVSMSVTAGHAYGLKPGYQAHAQLVFADGWARYDAGCLKWMPHVRSWYNICVGPKQAVVVAKY